MKLEIYRLDYKNPTLNGRAFPCLPNVDTLEGIDENEIRSMTLIFDTLEQAQAFSTQFPKYCKASAYMQQVGGYNPDTQRHYNYERPVIYFSFNTVWLNETTGDKNETALKRKNKVLSILRQQA